MVSWLNYYNFYAKQLSTETSKITYLIFFFLFILISKLQLKSGETAANIARELAEQTRNHLNAGDITYSVRAMDQLVGLLDVQLRNLTPGGKDSAARSLNKVRIFIIYYMYI